MSPLMDTVSGVSSLLMRTGFFPNRRVSCSWLQLTDIYRGCALEPADGDRVRGTVQPAHEDQVLLPEQAGQLLLTVTG
jgi:hypothetical protein